MSHTVTGKLNKAATQFQAGESVGFGIRLGQQYYDRETKQKDWTNYELAIFARQPSQIQYYQQVLVEGSIVSVSGESIKIKKFQGQNDEVLTLVLNDAKLSFVYSGQQAPQQQQYSQVPQQQGGFAPQQNNVQFPG